MSNEPRTENPELAVTSLGRGQYRVFDGHRHRFAYAAGPPEACWVFFDGRVFVIDLSGTRGGGAGTATVPRGYAHDDEMALASPMPATVATILVNPGQQVARGDVLLLLEAMKMELPIRAPRDGRIAAVRCRPGQLVQPGVPLIELD